MSQVVARIATSGSVAVFAALLASPASANDASMRLAGGGLVLHESRAVSIVSERLEISRELIGVDYVFRNRTRKDVEVVVGFPLPPLTSNNRNSVNIESKDLESANFVHFVALIDGQPVGFDVESRALLGGRDITATLEKIGVTPLTLYQLETDYLDAHEAFTAAQQDALLKAGILDPGLHSCTAPLSVPITFFWEQVFPARRDIHVRHTYRPVAGSSFGPLEMQEYQRDLCYSAADIARHEANGTCLEFRQVEYILTTARTWRGPIGDFHLIVRGGDSLLTCLQALSPMHPGQWEWRAKNFVPEGELVIGFCDSWTAEQYD